MAGYSHLETELERNIHSNFSLHPNDFTKYLEDHLDNPVTYQTLCRMLTAQNSHLQDQLKVATSLNFVVGASFRLRSKNPQFWHCYYEMVAANSSVPWKIVKVVERSFKELVESFQGQFGTVIEDTYPSLSLSHKIILQNIVIFGDVGQKSKVDHIDRHFRAYFEQGKDWILQLFAEAPQEQITRQMSSRILQFLLSIEETLQMLAHSVLAIRNAERLMMKISQEAGLMELAEICLLMEKQRGKFMTEHGSVDQRQAQNQMKSVALRIINLMLGTYSKKCTVEDFDHFRVLGFMETQVPLMVMELKTKNSKQLNLECNDSICMAMIEIIKTSSSFIFMSEYFWSNYKQIFWTLLYPLLSVADEEKRMFKHDHLGFIKLAECIAEGNSEAEEESIRSIKIGASELLEQIIENIDGAMTNLCTDIFCILEHSLGKNTELSSNIIADFVVVPSIETVFTILTILSNKIRRRQDLKQILCQIVAHNSSQLHALKDIQQARFLIASSYCFDILFYDAAPPKQHFEWVASGINGDEVIVHSTLMFFENCVAEEVKQTEFRNISHSYLIWQKLIDTIPTAKHFEVLHLVAKTLSSKFTQISHETLMRIVSLTILRLKKEGKERQDRREDSNGDMWIAKCLIIIRTISKRIKVVRERGKSEFEELCAVIWGTFQLMQDLGQATYGDEVIDILNFLLSNIEIGDINEAYYQFLKHFTQYHMKWRSIGNLSQTYLLLLTKGHVITESPSGQQFLEHIVDNVMLVMSRANGIDAIQSILLMQFIVLEFPTRLDHKTIYQKTRSLFDSVMEDEPDNQMRKQKTASIFNMWVLGSIASSIYPLEELASIDFLIFSGQHADILVYSLCKKIKNLCQASDKVNQIIFLFQKTVDMIKIISTNQNGKSLSLKNIPHFNTINPFENVKETLQFAGQTLKRTDFDIVLQEIHREMSRDQLLYLINRVKVKNEQRVIFKIK